MTEKQIKIQKVLSQYSSEDLLFVLHECVELLVPLEPSELANMESVQNKTIHNRIKAGKYLTFNFINRKFPIINDHL